MASLTGADQYFVYENRLASFLEPQPVAKRRASNAGSRTPKTLTWPHKFLPPFELAKAGFYFDPHPSNPDNVTCFLCHKQMDGWEAEDNPIEEHLKHSPSCGWAVTAAVEAECDGLEQVDPREARLLEARKATFAGRWPYESKKAWKCKTKQLAEAGWIYTPTNESDDNTTCAYCQLALDGWEASDKPIDEHYKRSPDCPFFEFINSRPPPKKTRAKAARGSKASRASTQSAATAASDLTTVTDIPADYDDSVMTTASVMTQNSKKTARAKKAPAAIKARKARTKKEEPVEIHEDVEPRDEEMPPPPPPKPARGRKRGSDSIEDSAITNSEAPAPKKRATRVRGSQNPDASVLTTTSQADVEMGESTARPKTTTGKKRATTATSTKAAKARKASAMSVASTASAASMRRTKVPVDDELDRQLREDLDRPLTDDEDIAADSDSERRNVPAATYKAKGKKAAASKASASQTPQEKPEERDYEMFDPTPAQPDEAAVEADLQALEDEVSVAQESQDLVVPKKGKKAGARRVSKQTKKAKASTPEPAAETPMDLVPEDQPKPALYDPDVDELSPSAQLNAEVDVFHDASEVHDSSTATIVKNEAPPKRGRGRPKKSTSSRFSSSSQLSRPSIKPGPSPLSEQEPLTSSVVDSGLTRQTGAKKTPEPVLDSPAEAQVSPSPQIHKQQPLPPVGRSATQNQPSLPPPATPSAKQAVLSPSQSPQSSDAENQPPSSRPPATAVSKRVVLAPAASSAQKPYDDPVSTPVRTTSPMKKRDGGNPRLIGGLQSATPWTAVDIDLIFANHDTLIGADDENMDKEATSSKHVHKFLTQGGDLSSPESRMTVEEWIYHNAGRAEQKLKYECEALVSSFEKEGTKAMRVLEELVVE
ncbi:hypothetical protein MCOR27_001909 [Pyricularia oryzae]|uniref:BIR-domain-containing protein n=2 Tax=Pyricularia TaxID=48558 RepID=A0ABQ8NVE6_PYRGI|nr:hypothetical protein MCOR01_001188 [Pyricularia oryzae]KAI6302434.1 hypothetical protein MCOR33_002180 [Pyricularia grisea]KAH9430278.1 hypothetical protein MCOR02_009995 [Pyricularia oryzae]KAI6252549.1 hypothetical protein MCOR19_010852 [Pyricularia oryzae]KAI6275476.1 hypothetical protein MCOR26_005997 [Pyricularia oryzae]